MNSFTQMAGRAGLKRRGRRLSGGLIASLVFPALFGLLAIAYVGFVLWPRHLSVSPADAPSLPITVAGVVFNVPTQAIRREVQRHSGAQDRIDLAFVWPSLRPPDPARDRPAPSDEPVPLDRLFVTIAKSDGTVSGAERMKTIYPRYLERGLAAEAEGLVARAFAETAPYRGEDLVFDPATPARFAARCTRAAATPGICLLERRIGTADLTVRFPRAWLSQWKDVATGIDQLIARLRPPTAKSATNPGNPPSRRDQAALDRAFLILEPSHRGAHAFEAELAVEALGPGIGVENDLSMPCCAFRELGDEGTADAATLKGRVYRHVTEIRAIDPVRQQPSGADQAPLIKHEARVHAVGERHFQLVRLLVAQGRDPVELRQLAPIDGAPIEPPLHVQPAPSAEDTAATTSAVSGKWPGVRLATGLPSTRTSKIPPFPGTSLAVTSSCWRSAAATSVALRS
jgi:hypothetical protein